VEWPRAKNTRSLSREEGAGTIKESGVWKAILGTPEGKVIERLFQRPEHHFAKMRQFKKLAKWLPADPADAEVSVPDIDFGDSDSDDEVAETPKADTKPDTKKTRVRKGKKSKSKAGEDGPVSHRFQIVGPTNEAINQFTTIVNSGCLGGG
jgi:hypothetical protein